MPRYYHESSYHKQTRFIRKLKYALLLLVIVAVAASAYIFIVSRRDRTMADIPSKPTTQTTAVYTAPVEVFSTQYFQFQANKRWTFIASESSQTKFVYRYLRESLIEHQLDIYIDPIGRLPDAARVLPVTVKSGNSLAAGDVSEMCKTATNLKNVTTIQQLTMLDVEFTCNPDLVAYTVAVGKKGDKSPFQLTRSDGTKTTYGIIYKNLTAKPDQREITEVINSFQAR